MNALQMNVLLHKNRSLLYNLGEIPTGETVDITRERSNSSYNMVFWTLFGPSFFWDRNEWGVDNSQCVIRITTRERVLKGYDHSFLEWHNLQFVRDVVRRLSSEYIYIGIKDLTTGFPRYSVLVVGAEEGL